MITDNTLKLLNSIHIDLKKVTELVYDRYGSELTHF